MSARIPVVVLAGLALAAVVFAAEQQAAAPAEQAGLEGQVQMVELQMDGKTVEGRLIFEDEKQLRVESIGAGVIGYGRGNVRQIRRFTISQSAFNEQYGDYHHERAWRVEDAPNQFASARRAYDRALVLADTDEARQRIRAKLEVLAADREEWQLEALRTQELRRARIETELAELEKQLTQEKIETLRRQEQELQALGAAVRQVEADSRTLLRLVQNLEADVRELEDDFDDLRDLDRVFIRNTVFFDLQRSHQGLEREVQRLRRLIDQK